MTFSEPFKRYDVRDPKTGRRHQLTDRKEAEEIAKRLHTRTAASKAYYAWKRSGKRSTRVNTKQTTLRAARRWVASRNVMQLENPDPARELFQDAVELWLDAKRLARRSTKTLVDYKSLTKFWVEFFRGQYVTEIRTADILAYLTKREAAEVRPPQTVMRRDEAGNVRKPGTGRLHKDVILLRSFWEWLIAAGRATANPVKSRAIPVFTPPEPEPRVLSGEEVESLLRACRDPYTVNKQAWLPPPHLYGIVLCALHTLLRLSNVLGLLWRDVDLRKREISIPGARVKARSSVKIPITPTLAAHLKTIGPRLPAARVFSVKSIKRSFASASKRAGISGISFHVLRKTGATRLLDAGTSPKTVMKYGGWKDLGVLMRHYAGATEMEKAAKVLDGMRTQA